jgi:hypothetical protein
MAYLNWSIPVSSLINKLQKAEFTILGVNDGEEYIKTNQNGSKLAIRKEAVETVVSVDESWIRIKKGDKIGTLFIVLGNEPWELVADYSDWDDLTEVVDEYSQLWEDKKCPVTQ